MASVLVNHVHPAGSSATSWSPVLTQAVAPSALKAKRTSTSTRPEAANFAVSTLARAVRGANNLVLSLGDGLTKLERQHRRKVEERRQILCLRMQNAVARKQWQDAAEELDMLEENDKWKLDPSTADYNPVLIEARLKELEEARTNCDIRAMLYQVRTALSRDLGGMGNGDLYRHCYVGTKELIERYVDSALQTIDALVEKSQYALPEDISQRGILESVLFARQSFGRSALLLSGGGTFGMSHIGVLKALHEVKLLPRIISGASAGSIVCAVMCTRTDEEIPELLEAFPHGDLSVFDGPDQPNGVLDRLRRLLTEGSWSDIKHLTRVMRGLLGDLTFQEAYNRTRRILNICVSTESIYELPRLLNYVTAPNVMIWSAVAASCSVPLVFSAAPLLVKVPETGEHMPWNPTPQRWIDGSVDNDLPMMRLAEMFNVNHFIVSQVNPHVVPFLAKDDQLNPATSHLRKTSTVLNKQDSDWVYTLTTLAKEEALHRLQFLAEIGIFPNLATKLRSVLSQKYSGDINIFPEISMQDLPRLLSNPTTDFMSRSCLAGERATWPKLSRIRDRCAIELGLDRAVHRLRARVVFSTSQVDLRRLATGIGAPLPWPKPSEPASLTSSHLGVQALSLDVGNMNRSRPRRSSGSSVQLMAHHRRLLLDSVLTDEETEEEERLEMKTRYGQTDGSVSPVSIRKPRLRRSAKSQSHFSTACLRSASPGASDISRSFDFGKAPTPPTLPAVASNKPDELATRLSSAVHVRPAIIFHSTQDEPVTPAPAIVGVLSSTDEPGTSEIHSLSSEGDLESHTDDTVSDSDPYDRNGSSTQAAEDTSYTNQSGQSKPSSRASASTREGNNEGLWD